MTESIPEAEFIPTFTRMKHAADFLKHEGFRYDSAIPAVKVVDLLEKYLTHPEAQGNKDLGEPALRALKEDAIYVLTDLIESQEYDILPWVRTCLRGVRQNVRALSCSSERSEAAPTSPQPIKGESRFTAACKAADAILAPMTAEFGRILEEAPTQPVTVSICSYSVEIPAKKFMDLYDATDRTESELESASNGMGLR